jgi:hypothetical protein
LFLEADANQKGQRQHHQRDMAVPADEAAYFIVIQPQVLAA